MNSNAGTIGKYKYLPGLLRRVRWVQHLAAILAEALILIAFLASGMDTSLNGVMANNPIMKWAWAAIFSLGVDTSFVISWVRCRQLGRSWHLLWSIPMALGISFVVFEPVVVQLYQQALDVDFSHALNALGINLPVLVYARAGVAVALGAILALTNGESSTEEEVTEETAVVKTMPVRRQRFVWLKRLWHWLRLIGQKQPEAGVPVAVNQEPQAQAAILQASDALLGEPAQAPAEQLVMTEEMAVEQVEVPDEIVEAPTAPLVAVEQSVVEQMEAPEQPADIVEQVADEAAQPIEGTAQSECPGMTRLSNGRRK